MIRQALAGFSEAGGKAEICLLLTILAEAQALDGALDDALTTIEKAAKADSLLVWVPEALICRGELRLRIEQTELAETDFRRVIAVAQKMNAKAWELRATIRLARLLTKQGKREEARATLAEIYAWFTEGFETVDLKDAKALLDELNR
jgi:predicted negative regulator of RcsB-dependent stress response